MHAFPNQFSLSMNCSNPLFDLYDPYSDEVVLVIHNQTICTILFVC